MKKVFLAFSILLSFSFSWAQERSSNPGNDPLEAMKQDGGGTNAAGVTGVVCANCVKNSWNGRLFDETNVRRDGASSSSDKEGSSKAEGATK